jgi:hypothetical protein
MRRLDDKGQILIFVTLGFVLLGIFTGLAIDMGRAYLENARLQRVVDAASIAAANVLKGQVGNEGAAIIAAEDAAKMNGYTCCSATEDLEVGFLAKTVEGGPPMQFVQITGRSVVPTTFSRLLNLVSSGSFDSLNVSAFAEAGPERPVDLMLVLDRSGSMDKVDGTGAKKITALKTAVTAFLNNNFTSADRIGLVSFASRGCGSGGTDSTATNCTPDRPLGTPIGTLNSTVNALVASGGTNTMESLRTAGVPINAVFVDATRQSSRKAILLVTDGQPTFMRRDNDAQCKQDPFTNNILPSPGNGNTGGGPFTNGCIQGVPTSFTTMLRRSLTSSGSYTTIPDSGSNAQLYKNVIRSTRDAVKGAMFEANKIRNYGYSGGKDVIIFVIAIGQDLGPGTGEPQSSLDENAKCLLARIANDPGTIGICDSVYTTSADGDTHIDLKQNWPCSTGPCIDSTQQQGRVFTVDVSGNVTAQLNEVFNTVAALLKLRLTI